MCKGGAHGDATVERGRGAAALTARKDAKARRGYGGGGRAWGDVRSVQFGGSWIRSPGEISGDPGRSIPKIERLF